LQLTSDDKYALIANYNGGSVETIAIDENGNLANIVQYNKHPDVDHGPEPNQEKAHAHSFVSSSDNKFVYSADLGNDRVY